VRLTQGSPSKTRPDLAEEKLVVTKKGSHDDFLAPSPPESVTKLLLSAAPKDRRAIEFSTE
jgi:hypothetical protein